MLSGSCAKSVDKPKKPVPVQGLHALVQAVEIFETLRIKATVREDACVVALLVYTGIV